MHFSGPGISLPFISWDNGNEVLKVVVIVDDDQEDIDILCEEICAVNNEHRCGGFVSPTAALELLRVSQYAPPDYVFVDVNMPLMSGVDFVREARKVVTSKETVIIGLSTGMTPELANTMIDAGANFAFPKPAQMRDYQRMLQEVFGLTVEL